ncbi:MAG: cytochrome b/b6 domain-containing protein [Burkholderiales bacterium]|nr:cytochrome b/b6 domain-containing protein [Burkholderiales bacterium]
MDEFTVHRVWDAPTRWFHWINALCVIALAAIGLVILNSKGLGIGNEGKITLKTVHTWVGYVFALNLAWRLVWAFLGNRYARWRAILPGGRGYLHAVRSYIAAFVAGNPQQYLGHNPLGRLAVVLLLALLATQAVTGLVLAGTDLFYPPFGSSIAERVAAPGVDPATLVPYALDTYDKAAYDEMRAMRKPYALVHLYAFYVLMVVVVLHVTAVIVTEVRERGNIVSAMFTGMKIVRGHPVDEDRTQGG